MVRTILSWVLAIGIGVIFAQSLFFKFTGHEDSVHIFSQVQLTIDRVMGLEVSEEYLRLGTGAAEALAVLLLLIPATRLGGAFLSLIIIGGAIFFHTQELGIEVRLPSADFEPDPTLFYMACGIAVASVLLIIVESMKPKS